MTAYLTASLSLSSTAILIGIISIVNKTPLYHILWICIWKHCISNTNESNSDVEASSLSLHGCLATQFNVLGSISVILPIMFLLSALPKRTWVNFRYLANSVIAQRFA